MEPFERTTARSVARSRISSILRARGSSQRADEPQRRADPRGRRPVGVRRRTSGTDDTRRPARSCSRATARRGIPARSTRSRWSAPPGATSRTIRQSTCRSRSRRTAAGSPSGATAAAGWSCSSRVPTAAPPAQSSPPGSIRRACPTSRRTAAGCSPPTCCRRRARRRSRSSTSAPARCARCRAAAALRRCRRTVVQPRAQARPAWTRSTRRAAASSSRPPARTRAGRAAAGWLSVGCPARRSWTSAGACSCATANSAHGRPTGACSR